MNRDKLIISLYIAEIKTQRIRNRLAIIIKRRLPGCSRSEYLAIVRKYLRAVGAAHKKWADLCQSHINLLPKGIFNDYILQS